MSGSAEEWSDENLIKLLDMPDAVPFLKKMLSYEVEESLTDGYNFYTSPKTFVQIVRSLYEAASEGSVLSRK